MKLLPFCSIDDCPACGNAVYGLTVKFSTNIVVPGSNGDFISVMTTNDTPVPHLEKHCPHCGYGWLEQTASDSKKEE